LFYNKLATE